MFHPNVLRQMVIGALECLLWSEVDDDGEPFDEFYNVYDITPESQAEIAEAVIGLVFTIPNDVAAMLDHYASTARGAQRHSAPQQRPPNRPGIRPVDRAPSQPRASCRPRGRIWHKAPPM